MFPTTVAINDDESSCVFTGIERNSIGLFRPLLSDDPNPADYDWLAHPKGRTSYFAGTAFGFPLDVREALGNSGHVPLGLRPPFAAPHGPLGHNDVGSVRTFDDLALELNNTQLAQAIQNGLDGVVRRPEISGNDLRDLIYFIRLSSVEAKQKRISLESIQ